jgi:DeoR/GlpR family transcriptional regulator of sugar metabolism
MMLLERQNLILKYLEKNRKATTNELSDLLNVSSTTIRHDLNKMEKDLLITKTHGGAVLNGFSETSKDLTIRPYLFHDRENENQPAKDEISNCALKYIKDNQCIILDASSTAYILAQKLHNFNCLTVITNGIYTALALKDCPHITVILVGGVVTQPSASIEGLLGQELLKKINADIAFVSARGFSLEEGLTDFSINEAELKKQFIHRSSKCIALIDHTKFDTVSVSSYASADDINLVITDSGINDTTLELYSANGIQIEI